MVEVATGSSLNSILAKVRDRETQWFNPLREKLRADGVLAATWPIRFLGFVRRANLDAALQPFRADADVAFAAIEDATFSWDYWEEPR